MPSQTIKEVVLRIEDYKKGISELTDDLTPFAHKVEFKEADDTVKQMNRLKDRLDSLIHFTDRALKKPVNEIEGLDNDMVIDGDDEIVTDDGSGKLSVEQENALEVIANKLNSLADRIKDDMNEIQLELQK
ncbi:MAG: hypothetical protein AAGG48_16480 [Planctomycetota bacterium]